MINILHIEKSIFFRKSLQDIIHALDHEVVDVSDTDEALEVLKSHEIDLIITALADNEDVFERLADSPYDNLPILVLTSTDDIRTREQLFSLGISDYILKNQITVNRLKKYLESFNKYRGIELRGKQLEFAVLDDSRMSLNIVRKALKDSSFSSISYFSKASELLDSHKTYDIYIIDLVMPEKTGEEVMLEIRTRNPQAVIIIISSIDHNRTISNILLNGADDFIVKPFDRNVFVARITAHIRTYFLRQELEEKNLKLAKMANTDGLTDVFNHKHIMELLDNEDNRAKRYKKDFSIAMLDIDYFKKVNDTYGHPVGDEILIEVASLLKKLTRSSDIVGRYGGEEFIVVFIECSEENALKAAEHIRDTIERHHFPYIGQLTISGGVCAYKGQSVGEMIAEADEKLYKAKQLGRNIVL
jgi:two-component system cell cycle response regulator